MRSVYLLRMNHRALWMLIAFVLAMMLGLSPIAADEPKAVVSLPVHGYYAFPISGSSGKPDTLNLLDTFTGETTVLASSDRGISTPLWSPDGNQIAFQQGRVGSSIWNINTSSLQTITAFPGRNSLFFPQGWSTDRSQVIYRSYTSKSEPPSYQLDLYNLTDGTLQTLFDFKQGQLVDGWLRLPAGYSSVSFYDIYSAAWNPVYQDWIIIQFDGLPPENQSDVGLGINILYNLRTHEQFLLDEMVENATYIGKPMWSPDGNYLFFNSVSLGDTIFQFSNSDHTFQLIDSSSVARDKVVFGWLGVQDLFLAVGTDSTNDTIFYVAQIIEGQWRSTEFFRLPLADFGDVKNGDWNIIASDEEKQALACLFGHAPDGGTCDNQSG